MGAVTNQRPDLFSAADSPHAGVMDMLRYERFTAGVGWVGDYGSASNVQEFQTLLRYSPLQNIHAGTRYPAVLVTTADHDDRVVPGHSFKYTAMLQAGTGGTRSDPDPGGDACGTWRRRAAPESDQSQRRRVRLSSQEFENVVAELVLMPMADLRDQFGQIDIYLFDQLLRGRIRRGMRILDAGCGDGRNLVYLLREGYDVFGADADSLAIENVRRLAAQLAPGLPGNNFRIEPR